MKRKIGGSYSLPFSGEILFRVDFLLDVLRIIDLIVILNAREISEVKFCVIKHNDTLFLQRRRDNCHLLLRYATLRRLYPRNPFPARTFTKSSIPSFYLPSTPWSRPKKHFTSRNLLSPSPISTRNNHPPSKLLHTRYRVGVISKLKN